MKEYGKEKLNPEDTSAIILSPITKALTNNNITLERLSKKLNNLIDCKRGVGVDKEGRTVNVPDNPSQLKAVDMGLKLNQAYPAERQELEITGVQVLAPAVKKPKSAGK